MEMLNNHCGVTRDARGVVHVAICNAGSLNILGSPVTDAVREGLQTLATDRSIRVVVLRGQSEKSMIGGADIIDAKEPDAGALDPDLLRPVDHHLRDFVVLEHVLDRAVSDDLRDDRLLQSQAVAPRECDLLVIEGDRELLSDDRAYRLGRGSVQ